MIKLKNFTLPNGTPVIIHILFNKGFWCELKVNGTTINKFGFNYDDSCKLQVDKSQIFDGSEIEAIVENNKLLEKGKSIMDFTEERTFFGEKTFVDVLFKNGILKVLFQDILIYEVETSHKKILEAFKNRDHFKGILFNDGQLKLVRFASLHMHSDYSFDDSIARIKDLANSAEYYAALTDHGNMHGTLKWGKAMKSLGKKPIFGFEGYIEKYSTTNEYYDNPEKLKLLDEEPYATEYKRKYCKGNHILLLAKNNKGLSNLIKLTSEGYNFQYKHPHLRYDMLKKYSEGVICTSACIGGVLPNLILEKDIEAAKGYIQLMIDIFGKENFFIEIQRHETKKMIAIKLKDANCKWNPKDFKKINLEENSSLSFMSPELKKIYKRFLKSSKEISIAEIIDFCELQTNLSKEEIIKEFKFKTEEIYWEKKVSKRLIKDVFFHLRETLVNQQLIELANEFDIKLIATTDTHFIKKEDLKLHDLWISTKNEPYPGEGYYFFTSEEMVQLYSDIPEVLDNTLDIAEMCDVDLSVNEYFLPDFPLPEGFSTQIEYFKHLCTEGYKKRFAGTKNLGNPEYLNRMKFEIATIERMGFPSYFLIVQDFIKWARDSNVKENLEKYFPKSKYDWEKLPKEISEKDFEIYIGPGRGSAAGSLVAYCLEIVEIDPIKYDLLFARFLNPSRISMPDIDVDIDDETRNLVFEYTRLKYGAEHTSRIITFGTLAAKSSVGFVQRVLQKPISLKSEISDTIPSVPNMTLKLAFKESVEFKEIYEKNPEAKEVIDLAKEYEGLVKNKSVHACGFLITPKPVTDYVPQIPVLLKDGNLTTYQLVTQWDKDECEERGVLKMDFLGLRTLSVCRNTLASINKTRIEEGKPLLSMNDIPIDDIETYRNISTGNTDGMFQIDSDGMKNLMIQIYQDVNSPSFTGEIGFTRLSDAVALYRPGPMDEIPSYIYNMTHQDEIHYESELLKKRISDTYGIIVYQEQAMLICQDLAGFSEAQADKVRKGMGKKIESILKEYREYFLYGSADKNIKGCIANGISEDVAISIWDKLEKFGKYAFNKSHSVAYAYLSAKTAWLKTHYPVEYLAATLSSFIDDSKKMKIYMPVVKAMGLEFLPPDINASQSLFTPENGKIRFGLRAIKNIKSVTDEIVKDRKINGPFVNYSNFMERVVLNYKISAENITALIQAGALDGFQGSRKAKIEAIPEIMNRLKPMKILKRNGQKTIFDIVAANSKFDKSFIEYLATVKDNSFDDVEEYPKQLKLLYEKKSSGMYITEHPIDEYSQVLASKGYNKISTLLESVSEDASGNRLVTLPDLLTKNQKPKIKVAGVLSNIKTFYTKKDNKPLSVFDIEDETGTIRGIIFEEARKTSLSMLEEENLVNISGLLQYRDEKMQIVVDSMTPIETITLTHGVQQISVKITDENNARQMYKELNVLAKDNPGYVEVLYTINGKTSTLKHKIDWNGDTQRQLVNLFGKRNIYVKSKKL